MQNTKMDYSETSFKGLKKPAAQVWDLSEIVK